MTIPADDIHPDDTVRLDTPPPPDDGPGDDPVAAHRALTGLANAAALVVTELRRNPAYDLTDLLRALASTAAATAVLLEESEGYTTDVSPEAVRPVRRARMLSWQAQRCLDTACHRAALAPTP
jgi:hypothetical protein